MGWCDFRVHDWKEITRYRSGGKWVIKQRCSRCGLERTQYK